MFKILIGIGEDLATDVYLDNVLFLPIGVRQDLATDEYLDNVLFSPIGVREDLATGAYLDNVLFSPYYCFISKFFLLFLDNYHQAN